MKKILIPPLVAVLSISWGLFLWGSFVNNYPIYLMDFVVSTIFISMFGYPIALIATFIGVGVMEVLKEYNLYKASFIAICGLLFGLIIIVLYFGKHADNPLLALGALGGMNACLTYYYLERKET